ncbi:MAG: CoB--CoM heterodisulfide reductase iron-sulfur subunit A family protein [Euryarchaeota archaeon]|nr:CoB--CoM heterodisulfide reductase iron-sulfur subunit A family protein [Euryarchaeota archaeon]
MEPHIGVFVCHCGTNIGGVVNVPDVVEYVKTLPNVVHAEHNLYTCADDGLTSIKKAIKDNNLDRVIVASCTPRTHEPLFRATCQAAGLNPYLFEFVNIREHCSWVHMKEPEKATAKAKTLIRMGAARAALLEPLQEMEIKVEPSVMVIGAGIAGMTSALSLANLGFNVYLVEREKEVGGMMRNLYKLFPTGEEALKSLEPVIEAVKSHEKIKLLTSSTVKGIEGYVGNFNVTVGDITFKVGTIIVATGAEEFEPVGLYGYGKYPNVMTQLQLEKALKEKTIEPPKNVVMIQCVGARGQGVSYCSRICCMAAIKNALLLKELYPESEVFTLHNDIQIHGVEHEEYYRKARENGVRFLRYTSLPVVTEENGLKVKFYDELLGMDSVLPADLVVLSTPLVHHPDAENLSRMLKVPLGMDKFFLEAHVKLRPVDFATEGIFLAGCAHAPADVSESVGQALGAAARAAIPMARGSVKAEGITASVDERLCRGCGECKKTCQYNAHELVKQDGRLVSKINEVMCKGCGACAVSCCNGAITMKHYRDEQVDAMIDALFGVV